MQPEAVEDGLWEVLWINTFQKKNISEYHLPTGQTKTQTLQTADCSQLKTEDKVKVKVHCLAC